MAKTDPWSQGKRLTEFPWVCQFGLSKPFPCPEPVLLMPLQQCWWSIFASRRWTKAGVFSSWALGGQESETWDVSGVGFGFVQAPVLGLPSAVLHWPQPFLLSCSLQVCNFPGASHQVGLSPRLLCPASRSMLPLCWSVASDFTLLGILRVKAWDSGLGKAFFFLFPKRFHLTEREDFNSFSCGAELVTQGLFWSWKGCLAVNTE